MQWTGGWTSLGGQLASSPSAVSRQAGVMDVYIAGTDGAVWCRSYSSGTWSAWYKVGGQVASGTGPAASGWPGREDVFIQGTDGALHQITWTAANGWATTWANLGGALTSSPAAVSRATGLIDVHVRGTDGADWYKSYVPGAWSGWHSLGGQLASRTGPALSVWAANLKYYTVINRDDVFVTGTTGAMYQKTWTTANGWTTTWANLGGSLTSSPTAATETFTIEIYVRWSNGNVYQKEYYDSNGAYCWHAWQGGMEGPPCQNNCY